MRLINAADLTFKSDAELNFMFRECLDKLHTMNVSTYEYSVMRDSVEVIKRALAARRLNGPRF